MTNKMVTATGKRMSAKKKMRHMIIEPSDNKGFSVSHHFMPPESSDEMKMSMPPEPETHVFDSADSMVEHVGKTFGGGKRMAAAGPKAPAKLKGVRDDDVEPDNDED